MTFTLLKQGVSERAANFNLIHYTDVYPFDYPPSARSFAAATTCFNLSIFCSKVSPGTGPVSKGARWSAPPDEALRAVVVSVAASGARSAGVSAPAAGEAVAAAGLRGTAEAWPVAACASAAGR